VKELQSYATDPVRTRGRLVEEPESATRTPHQRDRDRIIHAAAFRRLEYKTQVFVYHEGDNYRTRLTHSLEVAQIARSASRALGLNEDLAEALALAHDLGHTPFGHAGEAGMNDVMKAFGGFDHNGQSLRIVTKLEEKYAAFDGLNLTWETLEGIAKHNGPLIAPGENVGLPRAVAEYNAQHDLELHTYAGAEAQIAALSDDIAYNNHDIEDGLRAGLFEIEDLDDVPLAGPVFHDLRKRFPDLDESRLISEAVRDLIGLMVHNLLDETTERLAAANPATAEDIRGLDHAVVAFSDDFEKENKALKRFLFERMYRHYRVNRMASKARRLVQELFRLFLDEPNTLPPDWRRKTDGAGTEKTAIAVADYIAGMTDRYAIDEHRRLFDMDART
jgi:dGTPase